jgi:hypothetical protein
MDIPESIYGDEPDTLEPQTGIDKTVIELDASQYQNE